jgi:hypothetical protein
MWVKLGSEFLNLDRVVRVRFSKSWNKEGECLVAEIETQLGGELRPVARYRGGEAVALQSALLAWSPAEPPVGAGTSAPPALAIPPAGDSGRLVGGPALSSASLPTLTDL